MNALRPASPRAAPPPRGRGQPAGPSGAEFPSLAFPADRRMLQVADLAIRLGCSTDHVYHLIEEGRLRAINIAGGTNKSDRRTIRIPVEAWNSFIRENTV